MAVWTTSLHAQQTAEILDTTSACTPLQVEKKKAMAKAALRRRGSTVTLQAELWNSVLSCMRAVQWSGSL